MKEYGICSTMGVAPRMITMGVARRVITVADEVIIVADDHGHGP